MKKRLRAYRTCRRFSMGKIRCDKCQDRFICFSTRNKNEGEQIFSVPNNREGQRFIELMRKFVSGDKWELRLRGRHSNRRSILGKKYVSGTENDVPIDKAEWWAIYLIGKIE